MAPKPFSQKLGEAMRKILSCCDRADDEEPEQPVLKISGPTNFRREDISIDGLTEEQQHFIRAKAIADAKRMWAHMQPLRSSPSGQFASPTNPSPIRVSYEEFTIPRPAGHRRTVSGQRVVEGLKSQGRRLSQSLRGQGYTAVGLGREDSKCEMRSKGTQMSGGEARVSAESDSVGGGEFEREMAKL